MILNINSSKISSQLNPLLAYLQKQQENQKTMKLVEIGITFLFISFFVFFAIKPAFLAISSLLGEIKSKEILVKELKTKINDIIAAEDLFSQVQERYSLVESSLPTNPEFFQVNSQITTLAQNNQVLVDRIDYHLQDGENYFTANISTSSSYLQAISLVSGVLQNRRLIDLKTLNISLGKNEQERKIFVSLPLKIYYWPSNVQK